MAHQAQRNFVSSVKKKYANMFANVSVLDVGSLNVNGTNREFFDKSINYLGVDVMPGEGVDEIMFGHMIPGKSIYDVVISTEVLEHDFFIDETMKTFIRVLKPGGLLILSAAGNGRRVHFTEECGQFHKAQKNIQYWKFFKELYPDKYDDCKNYYKNITREFLIESLDVENNFSHWKITMGRGSKDIYFYGLMKKDVMKSIEKNNDKTELNHEIKESLINEIKNEMKEINDRTTNGGTLETESKLLVDGKKNVNNSFLRSIQRLPQPRPANNANLSRKPSTGRKCVWPQQNCRCCGRKKRKVN